MSAALQGNPWAGALRPAPAAPPPLLDLLGASWALQSPVTGLAWAGDVAGFALGDGSIVTARAEWAGAPQVSLRDGGLQVEPARTPPPPVSRQHVHEAACLAIAVASDGFVSGGADGTLAHVGGDGSVGRLAVLPGPVEIVVTGAAGSRAASAGQQVHVFGLAQAVVDLPAAATALAFDAAGGRLAASHEGGVTLWSAGETRLLPVSGAACAVAWSPDGAYLACGVRTGALLAWRLSDGATIAIGVSPGPPRALAFSGDGRYLVSSGAPRVLCWAFDPPASDQTPTAWGRAASKMPVCRVACHPGLNLIAAGYQNGAVLLCQPGTDEVLFVRASGLASASDPEALVITALAWSDDGGRLAMGTAGGEIGVLAVPAGLFRATPSKRIAS